MTAPFRISLLGLVGSGKSHLARRCAQLTGGIVLPFAQEVYALAETVLNRPVSKSVPGDRELLTLIGTTWGREGAPVEAPLQEKLNSLWVRPRGYPDIWVDSFVRALHQFPEGTSVFNDDTRFPNEVERLVRDFGFTPFFVACSEPTRRARLRERGESAAKPSSHESERFAFFLRQRVFENYLMNIIWNDRHPPPSKPGWLIDVDDFFALIAHGDASLRRPFRSAAVESALTQYGGR